MEILENFIVPYPFALGMTKKIMGHGESHFMLMNAGCW
jgi:hypothetical protein